MSEMKLIMENWKGFVSEEQLKACPQQRVSIDTFLDAIELAMLEPAAQKEKIEELRASKQNVERLNKVLSILSVVDIFVGGGAGSVGAGFLGMFANAWRKKQENAADAQVNKLLTLLCIDEALLDTVQNSVEKLYWSDSDLKDKAEAYVSDARNSAQPDPMPDFTEHFIDWLNNDSSSPYSDQQRTTGGPDTEIVEK